MSVYKDAHRCATFYSEDLVAISSSPLKKIIREIGSSCYRAGFQSERPDSHWFLEQWFPLI